MQAMILAAGRGSRLGALSEHCPKALMRVGGQSLIARILEQMRNFERIFINLHYLGEQIFEAVHQGPYADKITWIWEEALLETGGSLFRAADLFDPHQGLLVHNADVWTDLDLNELYDAFRLETDLALLAVQQRYSARGLAFDEEGRLLDWAKNRPNYPVYRFSGIQVLNPNWLKTWTDWPLPFSLTQAWWRDLNQGPIRAYDHSQGQCWDVGKPETLSFLQKKFGP